ncbi:MAG TPA: hypothetical protein VIZ86_16610 [Pseudomonas sp.]
MSQQSSISDAALEVVKSAPPVAVSGMTLAGLQLNDLVLIATLAWIFLQAGLALYDRAQQRKARRRRYEASEE